jgi:hypothetical protein
MEMWIARYKHEMVEGDQQRIVSQPGIFDNQVPNGGAIPYQRRAWLDGFGVDQIRGRPGQQGCSSEDLAGRNPKQEGLAAVGSA